MVSQIRVPLFQIDLQLTNPGDRGPGFSDMSPQRRSKSSRPLRLTLGGNQCTMSAHEAFLKNLGSRDPDFGTTWEAKNSCPHLLIQEQF